MPVSLVESQLATLEPLQGDEPGAAISGAGATEVVVDELLDVLARERGIRRP
jgi:gluconokinase